MTIALGFYLSMGTVSIVFFGGVLRWMIDRRNAKDEKILEAKVERGTIFSSGLIAGGAIAGLLGALLSVLAGSQGMSIYPFYFGGDEPLLSGNTFAIIAVIVMFVITYLFINKDSKKDK